MTVKRYRQPDELAIALPDIEEVARRPIKEASALVFSTPRKYASAWSFCPEGLASNPHSLYRRWPPLFLDGNRVRRGFISDYNAYDPAFRDCSLGTLTLVPVIEDCCQERLKEIDFGFGQAEYKERFGNRQIQESSVYVFAPSLRGFALNGIRTVSGSIDRILKATLERTQLLSKVKRAWRRHAATAGSNPAAQARLRSEA